MKAHFRGEGVGTMVLYTPEAVAFIRLNSYTIKNVVCSYGFNKITDLWNICALVLKATSEFVKAPCSDKNESKSMEMTEITENIKP